MGKRFVLFIGLLVCVFFLFGSNVFALSFNVLTYDVGLQPDSAAVGTPDHTHARWLAGMSPSCSDRGAAAWG